MAPVAIIVCRTITPRRTVLRSFCKEFKLVRKRYSGVRGCTNVGAQRTVIALIVLCFKVATFMTVRYTWRLRQVNETQVYIFVWCDIEKTIPDRYAVIQHIFTHGLVMKYLIFAHTIEQCRWTWCSHAMLVICCLGLGSGKETNGIHDTTIQSMIK